MATYVYRNLCDAIFLSKVTPVSKLTFHLYVTEATQFCVHGGLQQIKGSLANPLSKINVTTSYENEASLH